MYVVVGLEPIVIWLKGVVVVVWPGFGGVVVVVAVVVIGVFVVVVVVDTNGLCGIIRRTVSVEEFVGVPTVVAADGRERSFLGTQAPDLLHNFKIHFDQNETVRRENYCQKKRIEGETILMKTW